MGPESRNADTFSTVDADGSPADIFTRQMLTKNAQSVFFAAAIALASACSDDSTAANGGGAELGSGGSAGTGAGGAAGDASETNEPELLGPQFVELGEAVSGDTVFLDIEPGTLGFHIILEDPDGPTGRETVGIQVIRSPSGEYVNRNSIVVGAGIVTGSAPYGVVAASVPQNPLDSAMPVESGQWAMLVAGFETSGVQTTRPMRVAAYIQKTDDGEFHGGELDLHVHLPKGIKIANPEASAVIDPSNAAAHPNVVARIDAFYAGLDELYGIGRGNVFFHEIDATYLKIGDGDILRANGKTGAVENGPGLHVIWVENLTLSGSRIWGISATNPGAAYETGHPISAVVLNIGAGNGAQGDGLTMLHEMGHFVGLFHTSELNRKTVDPLTDTPPCTIPSGPCPDAMNLMFPTFWGSTHGAGIVVSDQQRAVVRGSVVYSAYPNDSYQPPANP